MLLSQVFLITLNAPAAEKVSKADVDRIIKEVDSLYRSRSSYAEIDMEIVTPRWQRTLEMEAWTKGLEKTFIRINKPLKEKGMGTLKIENEMWNYLPKTNKVIKIPPSMMMGSWMGSDFTNDDLVKEFSLFEDYTYELLTPEEAGEKSGSDSLIYINCIPRPDLPIVWGNIVIAVREKDHLPVWQKYYDEKGNMMRVMNYREITDFGDRRLPAVLEMIPQDEEGHKTVIRYEKIEFNVNLSEDIFTLRNLRTP
jgi:outer membrane lipoprotein-sorting protein